jgi:hypothetical protein
MAFMRVSLVKLLRQAAMKWVPVPKYILSMRVGSYDHVPSCQVPEAAASQGPRAGSAYPLLKAPGHP